MSGYDRLETIIRSRVGRRRPVLVGVVVDVSRWSATGPSWVGVRAGGDLVQAWWSDAPQPAVGVPVRVVRARSTAGSWWLALPVISPVAAACPGRVYVSARADGGDWAILKLDLVGGNTWSVQSAHPVSGYDRRPLSSYLGTRLLAWGSSSDLSTPGPLYYSDDEGVTWTDTGIAVVNVSATTHHGFGYAVGGTDLYQTTDGGATWAAVDTPGGTLYAVDITSSAVSNYVAVLGSDGVYYTDAFGGFFPRTWDGPFTPGGPGWVEAFTQSATWWTGGTTYTVTGNVPTAGDVVNELPGGGDSSGQSQGSNTPYHSATGGTGGGAYTNVQESVPVLFVDADGVGAADALIVTGNVPVDEWPVDLFGFEVACDVVALQGDVGGARFVAGDYGTGPYTAVDGSMATDLGDLYTASPGGLATLELWETQAE